MKGIPKRATADLLAQIDSATSPNRFNQRAIPSPWVGEDDDPTDQCPWCASFSDMFPCQCDEPNGEDDHRVWMDGRFCYGCGHGPTGLLYRGDWVLILVGVPGDEVERPFCRPWCAETLQEELLAPVWSAPAGLRRDDGVGLPLAAAVAALAETSGTLRALILAGHAFQEGQRASWRDRPIPDESAH